MRKEADQNPQDKDMPMASLQQLSNQCCDHDSRILHLELGCMSKSPP